MANLVISFWRVKPEPDDGPGCFVAAAGGASAVFLGSYARENLAP
jgi:hypothetical protein